MPQARASRPCTHLARTAALAFALAFAFAPAAHAQASTSAPAAADDGVDATTLPGDDFFQYANGAWLKTSEIPAGRVKWRAVDQVGQLARAQVAKLMEDLKAAPPGSVGRKVADFRAAYLNDAAIQARGMAPVRPMLDRVDSLRDKADLVRYLGSELRADVDPMDLGVYSSSHLFGLAVQAGNHGEKDHVAYLLQGGLELPREDYLGTEPRMQAARAAHRAAIAHRLGLLEPRDAGAASTIANRADAVLALESAIAASHATAEASGDEHNTDTLWTAADFAREAPGMDWTLFFASAGLAKQPTFVAWQPSALKAAAALVASQPLTVWKDYLRVRVIGRYADVLPPSMTAPPGQTARTPAQREQAALDATQSALGEALGRLYVERHFPPTSKARVQIIAANVVLAFMKRVEAAPWMTPASKAIARTKLETLYFGVGYPDAWHDESALVVDASDPVGNLQRVAQRNYTRALARLGQPIDRFEWAIAPQWPGAVLTFNENTYSFAAALLQPPKFDPAASDAVDYGAIGAIIGHEVSHFVDSLGAEYEPDGRLRRWWTAEDIARYSVVTEPLVRQFSAYQALPGVAVDGKLGLSENMADLGGLVAALDAFHRTLGDKVKDKAYVREQDRQFFTGFARAWRAKYTADGLKTQALSDHAPEQFRVWTVRNVDAWYDAFDVKPGQRLYLEPSARVRIW